jgi:hypothetical protein
MATRGKFFLVGITCRAIFQLMLFDRPRALFLAAMIIAAALVAPSFAQAHDGRTHFSPLSGQVDAVVKQHPSRQLHTITKTAPAVDIANAVRPHAGGARPRLPIGCGSDCCGPAGGMACCVAALAPELCSIPLFEASLPFLMSDAPLSPGVPPEAPPKPPKSFA